MSGFDKEKPENTEKISESARQLMGSCLLSISGGIDF